MYVSDGGSDPILREALRKACAPYRPNTMRNYKRQFNLFLFYSMKRVTRNVLSVTNLLSFLECLHSTNMAPRSISNYVSAIRAYLNLTGISTQWMDNRLVQNYMRAINLIPRPAPIVKAVISLPDMHNILWLLGRYDAPLQYRAAFQLSFYCSMDSCAYQI